MMICFVESSMLLHKQSQSIGKAPMEDVYVSRSQPEEEEDILEPIYDDTKGIIDKQNSIKWGEV